MNQRIAIVGGVRSPLCKAGGVFRDLPADDLGALVVREAIDRAGIDPDDVDEVVLGNVAQPAQAANIARVVALKAGLPERVPALTVQRNCASGAEALIVAAERIRLGEARVVVAGGTESMSQMPFLVDRRLQELLVALQKARTWRARLAALRGFRPRYLKPVIGLLAGLTDPVCGLIMGQTAELLARQFHLTREAQDAYALESQRRAAAAIRDGFLAHEIMPLVVPPRYEHVQGYDDGVRFDQTAAALAKLPPYFDRHHGTVTVGNSSQLTDGAAAMVVMSEQRANDFGLQPLGYLLGAASAGVAPQRMGLGPVFATERLCREQGLTVDDFDLVELNEAFAAVVLANQAAFGSVAFARQELVRDHALGELDPERLNVNGGAISLGHPVGMTGARLVITLLHALRQRGGGLGLATMCVGGGQGTSLALEAA